MRNHFELDGKVAFVTGASSGIGRATAVALAACGARVAVNFHRNESGAEAARAEITNAGGSATVVQADVTRAADVRAVVEENVLTAPAPPGSVDKGERQVRGRRLVVSTPAPQTRTRFRLRLSNGGN